MTRLLPTISLLLLLLVGWVQANHEVPEKCRALLDQAKAVGAKQPNLPPTMSEEEQAAVIKTWKAQKLEAMAQADDALQVCLKANP